MMQVTITRISISSAFRVGAVVSALVAVIFFLLFLIPTMMINDIFSDIFADIAANSGSQVTVVGPSSSSVFGSFLITVICGVPFYAIIGGVVAAIHAAIYNVAAGWIGGLQIDMARTTPRSDPLGITKAKNSYDDDPYQ
jgi:hypothetical protein